MLRILYLPKKIFVLVFIFFLSLGLFTFFNNSVESADSDAIAMRVFPNPDHFSALSWYQKQNFSGTPQSILVDGYEAVRDGHSVYVNVANLAGSPLSTLYTNIYLITYNQDADNETTDIFGNILDNWKFNANITGSGYCINDPTKNCVYDDECSVGDYCNSLKARVIRDTKRLSDLATMDISLENYFLKNGKYPALSAGSYLPGKSLSVWPSWNSTLSSNLGTGVPVDPINKIGPCGSPGFNEDTCWNDVLKTFVTTLPAIPANSMIYGYFSYGEGSSYDLCASFETPFSIAPPPSSMTGCVGACIDLDGDGFGVSGSTLCSSPLADCDDTPVSGFNIHPGAAEICGDGIDQDCNGSDLACAGACVDSDGDSYDNCDPTNPSDTDGLPMDCDDASPGINPGAIDICDGINNNCVGGVDESCDVDNDDYCSCSQIFTYSPSPLSTCTHTDRTNATTLSATCDCDDGNPARSPGSPEVCDGIDNNCSTGPVDETCDLDGDDYCECSGPTIVIGSSLTSTCSNTNTSNPFWIAQTCDCVDASGNILWHPGITEPNCTDGLDGDCDGLSDASDPDCFSCMPSSTQVCGTTDVGECAFGTQTCNSTGSWGACIGEITSVPEICTDGLDNDCDGLSDASDPDCFSCMPSSTQVCGTTDVGECAFGTQTCDSTGSWGACIGEITSVPEICSDGLDNDCDGVVDSGCGSCVPTTIQNCGSNVGECVYGTQTCDSTGNWGTCIGGTGPTPEDCSDMLDNDCDGVVNNGCTTSCTFPFTFPCTF